MTFAFRLGGLCAFAAAALLEAAPCVAQEAAQQGAAQEVASQPGAAQGTAPTFKAEEIDQLVAPVALYPDSLLAQIFMASTYPLEIVEAARWQKEHPDLKDKALEDALQSQTWDPSVKSLVAFPQVLTMMNEKLDWTQKLGDACLAQQDDVMVAVQRLRNKAKAEGNLETTKEQKVIVEEKPVKVEQTVYVDQPPPQTIVIEPADPQVVYVPSYNPTTVYGGWPYPTYPPYSYYPPGYVAATSMMSFGVGMAVGAALWGDCDWNDCCGGGGGDNIKVNVNNYNNFNKTDIKNGNWEHKPEHRKGVGYRDGATQQRFGKGGPQTRNQAAARDNFRGRADSGRQDLARPGGADRARQQAATADRSRQGGQRPQADRAGQGAPRQQPAQAADRAGTGSRERAGGQRQPQSQRRDAGARQQSGSGAFQGMGSSGKDVRRQSDRGHTSRQSATARGGGGGGNRSGGGGRRSGGGGGRRR